jgi:hypothetical protein
MPPMWRLLPFVLVLAPACAYRVGSGLTAGVLEELDGQGRSQGLDGTVDTLLERALLVELGHQLGQGLTSGASDITPEQQARLEAIIDGILLVAAKRAGKGLRTEVSPELREMVREDIVRTFAEGVRGELGGSLEETVDRVVARAVISLRDNLADEDTKLALSTLIRDSVYHAMREGRRPVGETLQTTLTENVLLPVESITNVVARQVAEQARRTENTLKSIITVLVLLSGVFFMLWMIRNRQVQRLQEQNTQAERGLRNVDAALEQLDASTREAILRKLDEYKRVETRPPTSPPAPPRGDDYTR